MSKLRADEFVNSGDNGAPSFPHSATIPAPTADNHFATKLYADTSASTKSTSTSITNTISSTAPSNPSVGDFWTDTSESIIALSIWNGSFWVNIKNSLEIDPGQIVTPPSISDPNGGYIPTMLTATSAVVSGAVLSSSKWYKDDVELPGSTGSFQFYATEIGTYKYEEIWVDTFGTQLFPSLSAVIDARAGVIDAQPTITSSNGVYSPTTLTATAAVVSNATFVGSKWYKDGVEVPGETGLSINILAHEGGIYKYEETWTDSFGTQLLPTLSASVEVFARIADPTVLTPVDDTGSPDFDYTAESSAITNVNNVYIPGTLAFSTTLFDVVDPTGGTGWPVPMDVSTGIDNTDKSLIWFKRKNANYNHFLYDTVRGTSHHLISNSSNGQSTGGRLLSYSSDGFSFAASGEGGQPFVAWNFRAAPGFFDVQTYTGISEGYASQSQAISHDLGSEPGMIIVKNLDDSDAWFVYHKDLADRTWIRLNTSGAKSGPLDGVFSPTQTSTEFNIGADMSINRLNDNYVAYLFADNPDNQITCGSFVGNGTGGMLHTLGYKPHWLLIKKASGTGDWAIVDSTRGNFNELYPNTNGAESTGKILIDFNPNGFYVDSDIANNGGVWDAGGETYIYVAIGNGEVDITTQSTASGTVSASSGNAITLSDISGTWSTGMKVQGTDSDIKDNPDPINPSELSLTSSEPATTQGSITTWGNAQWQIAEDSGFTTNLQSLTSALTSSGTQTGPTGFTLDYDKNYYVRTKYGSSNPAGIFSNWSVANLFKTKSEPLYADDLFSTYLYTGNGSTQTIANGIDLAGEGGLVWIKNREKGGSPMAWASNYLFDTGRNPDNSGSMEYFITSRTSGSGPTNSVVGYDFGGWASNGFLLGQPYSMGADALNGSGDNFVSWTFRKQPGFFDIVTYTGTGSAHDIAHNLGSVPGMIIVKQIDTERQWFVYHRGMGAHNNINLDSVYGRQGGSTVWNDTEPTSTHFTVGTGPGVNNNGGQYIAYIFAHDDQSFGANGDESIIKCGTYTGGTDGNEIDLGWEPQFILLKAYTNNSRDWIMVDSMRGLTADGNYKWLEPSTTDPEGSNNAIAPTSTGFKLFDTAALNLTGVSYIYMAIRRPHKPATVATDVFTSIANVPISTVFSTGFDVDLAIMAGRDGSMNYWGSRLRGNVTYHSSIDTNDEGNYNGWDFEHSDSFYQDQMSGNNVGWFFKRAEGFFDVVTYTGGVTNQSITHNLGVKPEFIITKALNTNGINTICYHSFLTANNFIRLNTNQDRSTSGSLAWNETEPTSTQFTLGNSAWDGTNYNGTDYVAYLFASQPGISKVGSFTGTGDNIDIDCGFAAGARFVLIKRTDSNGDWYAWDAERGITSGNDPYLKINTADAEVTNTDYIDPFDAGFTVTSSAPDELNVSGGTYIFLAIA